MGFVGDESGFGGTRRGDEGGTETAASAYGDELVDIVRLNKERGLKFLLHARDYYS